MLSALACLAASANSAGSIIIRSPNTSLTSASCSGLIR
jgi:hypothetical protein